MAITNPEQQRGIEQLRDFFQQNFRFDDQGMISEELVRKMLENPALKHYLFSDSGACIVDNPGFCYRYVSESTGDLFGVTQQELFEKGPELIGSLVHPDDLKALLGVFAEASNRIIQAPFEHRLNIHFSFSCHYNTNRGHIVVYQLNIPMALSEQGLPSVMLSLISNITEYSKSDGVNYRLSLNTPGQPVKILYSGNSTAFSSPLTEREKEIVKNLAEGMDAREIASALFISEGTVRTHRKNILEKTKAKNSVHLIRMAIANGWV